MIAGVLDFSNNRTLFFPKWTPAWREQSRLKASSDVDAKWFSCLPSTEATKSDASLQDLEKDLEHIAHGSLCHFGEISSAASDVTDCTVDAAAAAVLTQV